MSERQQGAALRVGHAASVLHGEKVPEQLLKGLAQRDGIGNSPPQMPNPIGGKGAKASNPMPSIISARDTHASPTEKNPNPNA